MSTLALLLVLASALSHAAWNAMLKGRGAADPRVTSTGLAVVWAVLGAPCLALVGPLGREAWLPLVASVAVHVVYFALLVRAYREADLSVIYTLARGLPPVLVAAASLALPGEHLGLVGLAGVLAIALGVVVLGVRGREAPPPRVLALAGAIAVLIAGYTLIDGLAVRAAGDAMTYTAWLVTLQGATFAALSLGTGGPALARQVAATWRVGLASGVLSAGGYGIALWAMTRAPISMVAALREVSVLFAAAIGTWMLREPFGQRRFVAAGLVAAGVIAVRLGGN